MGKMKWKMQQTAREWPRDSFAGRTFTDLKEAAIDERSRLVPMIEMTGLPLHSDARKYFDTKLDPRFARMRGREPL